MRHVVKKILTPTVLKRTLFFLLADTILVEAAVYLSFFLRFEGVIPFSHLSNLLFLAVLAPLVVIPLFLLQKIYWVSWPYVGLGDFVRILRGVVISFLFIGVIVLILRGEEYLLFRELSTFPRSTLFISAVLATFFIGALRASKRVYLHSFHGSSHLNKEGKRVLIIGAGDAGEQILRSILHSSAPYVAVGLVDDDPLKHQTSIHGYRVLGTISDLPRLATTLKIEGAIIALPSSGSREIQRAVHSCREADIQNIKIVPSLTELISSEIGLRDLREIQIEDLLGRDPVKLATEAIAQFISGKTVLITGAAGSVGSELARQIAKFQPRRLLLLDREETNLFYLGEEFSREFSYLEFHRIIADIRHKRKIENLFLRWKPEIVFHAAAYKHVPVMEDHPDEAVANNILGTLVVGEAAIRAGTNKVVFISTDKAVNAKSVMGITKYVAEVLCLHLNQRSETDFVAVRFGNVLESRGSVVAIFRDQIKRGGPVTITHPEMKRYFMAPSEAALLVTQAGAVGVGGKVYILDMGEPIRIEDLAREMIRLSGYEPDTDIPIVFTKPRPGEKLFEELFREENERVRETSYPKILEVSRTDIAAFEGNDFPNRLKKLFQLAESGEREDLIKELGNVFTAYS